MSAPETTWPADAVEVGIVIGAWGIRGALKVKPHAADPQALLASRHWFLRSIEGPAAVQVPECCSVVKARAHAEAIVAELREVPDRNAAEGLKGARIFVSRAEFPKTSSDQFYWVDLIGLSVVNRQGDALGSVAGLIDTGAHSVLRVATDGADERLIPFVDAYVDSVDLAARRIIVDWGLDY